MSKEVFDRLKAGLEEAAAYAAGDTAGLVVHTVEVAMPDVKAIRSKLRLSQAKFAAAIRVSPSTLKNWEQRRRRPEGPALALLEIVDKEPEAAMRALAKRAS